MIAAIVLAAGSSTRMGLDTAAGGEVPSKALLPLGAKTVIERVVGSVRTAGVDRILVVTGHAADRLAPALDRLGVRHVHNAGHLAGMFSSVQTGVRALDQETDAFFVLPVDYALIRPQVLELLVRPHRGELTAAGPAAILHPTCCDVRGHPPLIPARYREELLSAEGDDGLRGFLRRHAADEHEVEVNDLTILLDMDTRDDYERMVRLAARIGGAATDAVPVKSQAERHAAGSPPPVVPTTTRGLSDDDSRYLRTILQPEEDRVRHCETVAAVATALAGRLHEHVPTLDVQLTRSAGLLHDMCKGRNKHALTAQHLLTGLGLARLGEVVGAHMVMPPEKLDPPGLNEEQLLYLADKIVVKDRVATIAERAERSMAKQAHNPDGMQAAVDRTAVARKIAGRVETLLGRPFEDVMLEIRANLPATER